MLRISQLKLPAEHTEEQLRKKIVKTLHINSGDLTCIRIRKRSLDARKKPELFYVYTVDVEVKNEPAVKKRAGEKVSIVKRYPLFRTGTWHGRRRGDHCRDRKRSCRTVLRLPAGQGRILPRCD